MLYSIECGKHNKPEADQIFSVAMMTMLGLGILIGTLGWFYYKPIVHFLSSEENLLPMLYEYIPILFLSAPFFICVSGISSFLICSGNPKLAMLAQIVANVVNILLDFVFIKYFDLGIKGAAYATLCGFGGATLIIGLAWLRGRLSLALAWPAQFVSKLRGICGRGLASGFNQFGLAVKVAIVNMLLSAYAGVNGLVAFSLSFQCLSIVSIFLSGVFETMSPMVGLLYGEKDITGIRFILKRVIMYVGVISLALFAVFLIYPQGIALAYGVGTADQLAFCVTALRIFVFSFLFRNFVLAGMMYAQVVGMKKFAFAITVLDGLGIIPLAFALAPIFGPMGIFAAFPITAALALLFVLYFVPHLARRSEKTPWYLFVLDRETQTHYQATVNTLEQAMGVSSNLMVFAQQNGLPSQLATRLGLAAEEMCVYTLENSTLKPQDVWIDTVIKVYPDYVLMNFKSNGKPFSPTDWPGDTPDSLSSLGLLKQVASHIDYSVILGLNSTIITINK